jgi:hypothetical protein
MDPSSTADVRSPIPSKSSSLIIAVILSAMAAGLGWGIRGQYGHETGAMIAGVLTSLVLVMVFAPHFSSLAGARAAALMTVGIGIGGSETYGQTIGLTQDPLLIGNWEALSWGMLGLAIKGGAWIGFAGVFLGIGLSGKRYHYLELFAVMVGLIGIYSLGVWLLNTPYDPSNSKLPQWYFSESSYFKPGVEIKPRREVWGGLCLALAGLIAYARIVKKDRLAFRLGLIAILGGALGFPGGQCIQAFHAWNKELVAASSWNSWFVHFNWWNMMETTFGCIWGGVVAAGVWWNRHLIPSDSSNDTISMKPSWEGMLITIHLILLLSSEFAPLGPTGRLVSSYTGIGLLMTVIPIIGILAGRFWPYMLLFPIVALPIVGKSIRALTYERHQYSTDFAWLIIVMIPIALLCFAALRLIELSYGNQSARRFASVSLLLTTITYFTLNTLFFDFPWPWQDWTSRTPNHIIFTVFASTLMVSALLYFWKRSSPETPS